MNRPNRVRVRGVGAYRSVSPFAFSGWRLTIPGGPDGGQYHGFIAPDSSEQGWPAGSDEKGSTAQLGGSSFGPWDTLWSGTALREGENRSDYVYRSSAEMRPRANASGGANVITAYQRRRTAGTAIAPGHYGSLGGISVWEAFQQGLIPDPCASGGSAGYGPCQSALATVPYAGDTEQCPSQDPNFSCPGGQVAITGPAPCFTKMCASGAAITTPRYVPNETGGVSVCPQLQVVCGPGQVAVPGPAPCYTSKCVQSGTVDQSGATSVVSQPPPSATPVIVYTVPDSGNVPVSPAPAPTVSTTPATSQSTSVTGISAWLQAQSIISGVPNMYIVGAGAVLAFFLLSGDKKGRR